ncbi:hypothetical protein A2U01_0010543, partial [Trifolium medium]|nr:hypothetical protein [Trifolium medium]
GRERKALQQAELYRNFIFRAYEKRVQPSIFVCEFLDPGNLVLRVTDKVDYPATEDPPFFLVGFIPSLLGPFTLFQA